MEFKGTKGPWEVVEHNWAETSIVSGNITVATISIYDEVSEETQEELEKEVRANFVLISKAQEMLEMLKSCLNTMKSLGVNDERVEVREINKLIQEATTIK